MADADSKITHITEQEAVMMGRIAHQIAVYLNNYFEPYGITYKQSKILLHLIQHQDENVTQRDIERVFYLRSSTITSMMCYLEKGGFIQRYTSEEDGRAKRIQVTQKGLGMKDFILENIRRMQDIVIRGLSEAEHQEFLRLLRHVMSNIEEII